MAIAESFSPSKTSAASPAESIIATTPVAESALLRFFDAFLQEQNIKWLLAIGSLILLSSSVMLVSSHWQEYPPVWQFIIMLGYCGLLYQAAIWSYYRLALRRTGTGLMALTLALLPALFFALAWLHDSHQLLTLVLFGLSSAFTLLASRRILLHFLRKPQPTFLIAYLLLCTAYALLPLLSSTLQTLSLLGLWLVVCTGTLKVSRHVFWLTEEQQAPRIFGFFPVALLSGLYLGLSALYAIDHIALEWLGLGMTLAAVPILLSADALHKVFLQRSGGLLNERPVAVILPVLLGLITAISGVVLTAAGLLPGHSLLAITPTALIAAGLLLTVAWRSQLSALVWLSLLLLTVSYNFAPAYFAKLALQLVDSGAALLSESKLPFGFYGLSYLPLLLLSSLAAVWAARHQVTFFSTPLQHFSMALTILLLALAYSHSKALLPVTALLTVVAMGQAWLFRSRVMASVALLSAISAAIGIEVFSDCCLPSTAWWTESTNLMLLLAGLFTLIAPKIDPVLVALPSGKWIKYAPNCNQTSLALSILLVPFMLLNPLNIFAVGLVFLLLLHSAHYGDWRLAMLTLVYGHTLLWLGLITNLPHLGSPLWGDLLNAHLFIAALALLNQWLLGYLWRHYPKWGLSQAFTPINDKFALAGLLALLVLYSPFVLLSYLGLVLLDTKSLLLITVLGVWALDTARRFQSKLLTVLGFVVLFAMAGLTLLNAGLTLLWLPLAWVGMALLLLAVLPRRSSDPKRPTHPQQLALMLRYCAWAVLLLAVTASLFCYLMPLWLAGAVASSGALLIARLRRQRTASLIASILLNAQLLMLVIIFCSPLAIQTVFDLTQWIVLPDGMKIQLINLAALPLAAVSGLSYLAWVIAPAYWDEQRLLRFWCFGLKIILLLTLWLGLALPTLTSWQLLSICLAFVCLISSELLHAYRKVQAAHIWLAQGFVLAAIAYLALHEVIHFGQGWSAWLVLLAAAVLWILSHCAQRHPRWQLLSQPWRQTALLLPAVAVGLLLYRHNTNLDATWLGRDSMALLLAAGAYGWYGYTQARQWALVLALGLINLTLLSLWQELNWDDPQFYLIPIGISILSLRALFHAQLPPRWRDPLNYLGALTILVSPLFNIVNGSWWHIFSLMLISLLVILAAIGFRLRSLLYTGAAFLLADLIAMVILGGLDNPSVLWLVGLLLGGLVIALAAFAERGRENLVLRLHTVSVALAEWR